MTHTDLIKQIKHAKTLSSKIKADMVSVEWELAHMIKCLRSADCAAAATDIREAIVPITSDLKKIREVSELVVDECENWRDQSE